jgi:hypothetical protein
MSITYGTGFPTSGRAVVDIADKISYIAPNETPFLVFSSRLGKETCHNPQFKWIEDEFFLIRNIRGNNVGAAGTGSDDIDFVSWTAGTNTLILQFNNKEDFRAFEAAASSANTAIQCKIDWTEGSSAEGGMYYIRPNSAGTYPIARDTGRVSFVWYQDDKMDDDTDDDTNIEIEIRTPNLEFEKGSNTDKTYGGIAQGADAVEETRKQTQVCDAWTQIFRTSMTIAGTLQQTKLYGGDELARLHLRKIKQHKIDMEFAMLFAGRGSSSHLNGTTPSGAAPTTYLTGLGVGVTAGGTGTDDDRGFIRSKNATTTAVQTGSDFYFNPNGTYSAANWWNPLTDAMERIFEVGSDSRVVLCSRKWLTGFEKGIRTDGFAQWNMSQSVYGIRVNRIEATHGDLLLVHEPLLRGKFENYAVVLDFSTIKLRPMQGRDTKLRTDIQSPDTDGRLDELITEIGLQVEHEEANAILYCANF